VTFHNGEKFNAAAVQANWEAYKRMQTPRPASFTNLPDETIFEIMDEYRVRFTFPEPDGLAFVKFLRFSLAAPAFFAQHQVAEKRWLYIPEPGPWGTGPFKMVEGGAAFGKPSERVVLEANENYWDRNYPKVKKVIFDNTLIGDREKAMELCRESEGQVDIVSWIRPLDTLKVAESPYAKVVKSKDVSAFVGVFNERRRDGRWKDRRLRKALNYGVNRKELWKYAAKGNAHNLGGFLPPEAPGYTPDITVYSYDTELARSLLKEAGYPSGFELKIITTEAYKLEAQIISKMLERVGLKVILDVFPHPEFFRRFYIPFLETPPEEQEWDIALSAGCDIYGNVGANFLAFYLIEESDFRWMEYDPVYEQMWKEMAGTVDSKIQEDKIRRMAKYVYDLAHQLFIYSPLTLYAVNKEVDFVPQKSMYLRFKETSVTDNHWSIRGQKE
jgi:peptide/nickel transport system substrate-binding protein